LEAEGRLLRRETARLGWGLGLVAVTLLFGAAGFGLCLVSLYLFLSPKIGLAAFLVTALVAFLAALVTAWGARRIVH
jgi:multisubunit Na+/H+ antiporter MnhB subunit